MFSSIIGLLNTESSWEFLKRTQLPIAVYGTGNGADKVFDEFQRLGISVSAVLASDGFVRNRTFRGFKVKSISQFENEADDFVIALAFASSLPEVINNIKSISHKHKIIMPSVPVYGDNIFNKEFLKNHIEEISSAYNSLSDNQSKKVLTNIISFQITGNLDFTFNCETTKDDAYSILNLGNDEVMFDLGAYRGDTIDEFLKYTNLYKRIIAVEPDFRTFKKLSTHCENMHDTFCLNNAIWSNDCIIKIDDNMGRGSNLNNGNKEIKALCVDSITEKYCAPSFINCDIEGAEKEMLEGAENTLKSFKPKMCISAYHRSEDIFSLINKIKEINSDYKIYLRHHPHISFWDTNIYCI